MVAFAAIRPVNLAVQMLNLKRDFPDWSCSVVQSWLRCRGKLTPSALSETYTVTLQYNLNDSPIVHVVDPALRQYEGRKPEHLYEDDSLCLYLPGGHEWSRDQLLVKTVVPWTCEWLLHYEFWLCTGEWSGGGLHPPRRRPRGDK